MVKLAPCASVSSSTHSHLPTLRWRRRDKISWPSYPGASYVSTHRLPSAMPGQQSHVVGLAIGAAARAVWAPPFRALFFPPSWTASLISALSQK
ncbi:hypothetical protein K402DRAFT_179383 [Aulographum hederae CBS 113979]|uniref:Uncharacterized protein n=1 Tax=Aulographum hederae CBS 113979 TaxID=1176131 RepID=A0A6G1GQD8_9PEZI|nr:hypothetical protein K402DRAFT_179383 [Aulographum hederae CBS 113979]